MSNLQFEVVRFLVQVAELYEDLKSRVTQFNMKVSEDTASLDYTSANRERFILQVGDRFPSSSPSGLSVKLHRAEGKSSHFFPSCIFTLFDLLCRL